MPGILGRISRLRGFSISVAFLVAAAGCGGVSDGGDGDGASPGVRATPTAITLSEDNGSTAVFVELNTSPNGLVALKASCSSSRVMLDPPSLTFNETNWSIPQGFTVSGVNNDFVDGNEAVDIALQVDAGATADTTGYTALASSPVGLVNLTVVDDDAIEVTVSPTKLSVLENSGTATFEVFLNTVPDGEVVILVQSGDTGEVTVDPAELVFTPQSWSEAQARMVSVTAQDDPQIDGNKAVSVTLTIDGTRTTDKTGYGPLDPDDVAITVIDDDTVGITALPSSLSINENAGNDKFAVRLSTPPNGDVVVKVASDDTGAAVVNPASLTFTPTTWDTDQEVVVSGVDDVFLDGVQTVKISLTVDQASTSDGTGYGNPTTAPTAEVQVKVLDDETPLSP
jgi:hypothetical protein